MNYEDTKETDYEDLAEAAIKKMIAFIAAVRNDPDRLEKIASAINKFKFYTYKEVAVALHVQVGTVRKWVSEGELSRVAMGSHALVPEAELKRFISERYISREEQQKQKSKKANSN